MLLLMLLQLPTNFAIPYNSRRIIFSVPRVTLYTLFTCLRLSVLHAGGYYFTQRNAVGLSVCLSIDHKVVYGYVFRSCRPLVNQFELLNLYCVRSCGSRIPCCTTNCRFSCCNFICISTLRRNGCMELLEQRPVALESS